MLETKSIVSQFPQVEAENLLIQIPEEVEWFHAHVGALDTTLEETPEVFEPVGVNLPVNVFLGMVDYLVNEILVLQSLIGEKGIGVDRAVYLHMTANLGLHYMLAASGNYHGANFAATFKNAHDRGLVLGASGANAALVLFLVHESSSATDEGFVYFHFLSTSPKFRGVIALHRKTDSVKHEPCGLLSDAKSAGHFVGTDAVFAVGNHPHCDEPLVERQSRILKDSPDLHRELFASVLALAFPHAASGDKANFFALTSRAGNAIGPAPRNHELEAVIGVSEVNNGLLEGLWFGVHGVPHCQNYDRNALLSQVYYCPCIKGKQRS